MKINLISSQNLIASFLFLAMIVVTVATAVSVKSHFDSQSESAFKNAINTTLDAVEENVGENLAKLTSIQGLFNVDPEVTREEFGTFVSLFLESEEEIQALEWIPRVAYDQMGSFIDEVRRSGLGSFNIHPTPENSESFPVHYVFPLEPNLPALGFDLASEPNRFGALQKARDTGRLTATAPITLVQETEKQAGFLVFAPVYSTGDIPATIDRRQETLVGFGLGVYRVDDFIGDAVPFRRGEDLDFVVADVTADTTTNIHSHSGSGPGISESEGMILTRFSSVAGRRWQFTFFAPDGFGVSGLAQKLWIIVLGFGIPFSASTFGFLYLLLNGKNRAISLAESMYKSLIETESQRDKMFELSQDLIVTVDREGRFVFVSGAARPLLGREPSDMIGVLVSNFVHSDDQSICNETFCRVWSGLQSTRLEVRLLRADGTPVWVEWNILHVDEPVEICFAVGRDVTDRAEMDRLKDEFISVASHELRTPVTSIKGLLEVLVDEQSGPLTEDQSRFLEIIVRDTDRLDRLVGDVLDISRIDSKLIGLEQAEFNLAEAVEEVISGLGSEIARKQIEVVTSTEGGSMEVYGDRSRINQIITNLLGNAVKYSPDGSSIQVVVSSWAQNNRFAQVSVHDEGPGILPEDIDRLFDKFYRADNSLTRSTAGTGLGLAIAKALVELHGGEIWVESTLGAGSVFSLTIPKERSKA